MQNKILSLMCMVMCIVWGDTVFSKEILATITASCPLSFAEVGSQGKLKLEAAEIWFDFLSLQEPDDSAKGFFSEWDIAPKGSWELRCKYQSGRETVIELSPATRACRSGRQTRSLPYEAQCTGASGHPETPPSTVHVIADHAGAINLKGFMIGQSVEQVKDVAAGMKGQISFSTSSSGQTAEITLGPHESLHITFDSSNHAQEIEWQLPDDSLRTAVLSFGFFDTLEDREQTATWTRMPGALIKAHWSSAKEPGNFIRLQKR